MAYIILWLTRCFISSLFLTCSEIKPESSFFFRSFIFYTRTKVLLCNLTFRQWLTIKLYQKMSCYISFCRIVQNRHKPCLHINTSLQNCKTYVFSYFIRLLFLLFWLLSSLDIFSVFQNERKYKFNDLGNKFQGWMTIFFLDLDQQKIRFFF